MGEVWVISGGDVDTEVEIHIGDHHESEEPQGHPRMAKIRDRLDRDGDKPGYGRDGGRVV
jgi:hypothetical protein